VVLVVIARKLERRVGPSHTFGQRSREDEIEALLGQAHVLHVGGGPAIPRDALQPLVAGPAVIGLADPQVAAGAEAQAVVARAQGLAPVGAGRIQEGDGRPLHLAAHFFEHHAQEARVIHFSDQELVPKRTERVFRDHDRLGRGIGQDALRKLDRCLPPHFVENRHRQVQRLDPVKALFPDEAGDVTVELIFLDVIELARSQPVALVVGHEKAALGAEAEAVGGAKSVGERRGAARLRIDLQYPASVRNGRVHTPRPALGGEAAPQLVPDAGTVGGGIERDVERAAGVARRPKGELVVVAAHAEVVGDGLVAVGATVAVGVGQARELGALRDQDAAVARGLHAERVVQPFGEEAPLLRFGIVGHHLPPVKDADEPPVGHEVEPAGLRHEARGGLNGFDLVGRAVSVGPVLPPRAPASQAGQEHERENERIRKPAQPALHTGRRFLQNALEILHGRWVLHGMSRRRTHLLRLSFATMGSSRPVGRRGSAFRASLPRERS